MTLIELLVATAIIAVALIPLLQLVPATFGRVHVSDTQLRLAAVGIRKAEELIGRMRADIASVASGTEACDDLPGCRVEWTIDSAESSGTPGVGVLKNLRVVACQDSDTSGICDATEEQARYDIRVTSRP